MLSGCNLVRNLPSTHKAAQVREAKNCLKRISPLVSEMEGRESPCGGMEEEREREEREKKERERDMAEEKERERERGREGERCMKEEREREREEGE